MFVARAGSVPETCLTPRDEILGPRTLEIKLHRFPLLLRVHDSHDSAAIPFAFANLLASACRNARCHVSTPRPRLA